MKRYLHIAVFLLVAINYFAFQVEFFDNEYQENHRVISNTLSISNPTVTWETFDKSNAPKAFTLSVDVTIELIGYLRLPNIRITPPYIQSDIIRDKSPPTYSPYNA